MTSKQEPDHPSRLLPPPQRLVSALQCYLTYIVSLSIGVVCWIWLTGAMPENDAFLNGLISTTVSTFVIWIFSMANSNSSLYDPYWVIAPPFLVFHCQTSSSGSRACSVFKPTATRASPPERSRIASNDSAVI